MQKQAEITKKAKASVAEATTAKSKDVDTSKAKEALEKALTKVLYGAEEQDLLLDGKSVESVRGSLKAVMNIPDDAQARVDGKPVQGDFTLQENQTLEFVKISGQKGSW